jgi:hypothetical protein
MHGSTSSDRKTASVPIPDGKRHWEPPRIEELPRLTDLTLLTGSPIPGGGGTGGGGSTVF